MRVDVNGIGLNVEVSGEGPAVLLAHGYPDTHACWRHQVAALNAAGYRTIVPDLRGFGASDKPAGLENYELDRYLGDLLAVLDAFGAERAHLVGHDWGSALVQILATVAPERVNSLTCLSVGHPAALAAAGWRQREKSWYMLLFQFVGIAEQWLTQNDFRNAREMLAEHPDADEVIERMRDPEALSAGLAVYRTGVRPETLVAPPLDLPPIQAPTLGVWSTGDRFLTEEAMTGTGPGTSAARGGTNASKAQATGCSWKPRTRSTSSSSTTWAATRAESRPRLSHAAPRLYRRSHLRPFRTVPCTPSRLSWRCARDGGRVSGTSSPAAGPGRSCRPVRHAPRSAAPPRAWPQPARSWPPRRRRWRAASRRRRSCRRAR